MSSNRPRIITSRAPVLPQQTTPEQRYWRQYSSAQLVKEHNAVTHIAFNPTSPHDFAVTSSTRVQLFSSKTRQVVKTFSRFKDIVYSASFRADGKLLVAGDATGQVSIYDSYNPRNILVSINASTHPTHVTKFHQHDNRSLVTASDDRITRVWDISHPYEPTLELGGATDYIRSISFVPNAPHLITTGSYDNSIRLYDIRNKSNQPIFKLNHGNPIEDIISISQTQLVSCGGTGFKVWDLTNNSTLFERGNFNKTVTCMDYIEDFNAPMNSALIASSLDGHVKVFDPLDSFKVKFGWKFSSAVLSCAISPSIVNDTTVISKNNDKSEDLNNKMNRHLVVGMSSGLLAVRTKKGSITKSKEVKSKLMESKMSQDVSPKSNNFQRMMRGSEYNGDQENIIHNDTSKPQQRRIRSFEKCINQFKWSDALDCAFVPGMAKELTVTILKELRKRGKIRVALYNRDETTLEPLLNWCLKGIEDVRFATIVADWIAVVLELYGNNILESSPVLQQIIIDLRTRVRNEIFKAKEAQRIEGMLQLLTN
ncbi:U3 small nucleolar RNA-associated protein 15 [Monosporozyma unispora]|nr:snoRNA-binding rRNA-processing protein [Kazachstania unispora]